jgi:hypothetical protein
MTDKVRDSRREGLNKWLQELLSCEALLLNLEAVKKIRAFIDFDINVDKMNETRVKGVKTDSPANTMLTQAVSERFMKRMQSSNPANGVTAGGSPSRS